MGGLPVRLAAQNDIDPAEDSLRGAVTVLLRVRSLGYFMRRMFARSSNRPLAPPYPDDPDAIGVETIDDPERRPGEFPQPRHAKFGDDAAALRELDQLFERRENTAGESIADLRRGLSRIPIANAFQVCDGRLGD
jgi:hypothetical protein